MKIDFKKGELTFMPKNLKQEKFIEKLRHYFDINDFRTDRIWSEKQKEEGTPLGVRIFLKKINP